jgi:hypothetical protein
MTDIQRLTGLPTPSPSPSNPGRWDGQRAAGPSGGHPVAGRLRGRFHRAIGFWLGGTLLGVGGCFLGMCMPYRHPVAVTISVLWWGIYLACFGASIGALVGLWAEQMRPVPPRPTTRRASNNQTSRPWVCSTRVSSSTWVSNRSARS